MSTNEEELSPLAADMAAVDAGVRALQRHLDDIHAARRHLAGPEVIAGLYDELAVTAERTAGRCRVAAASIRREDRGSTD